MKKLLLPILMLLVYFASIVQEMPNILPPSPDVLLGKYIETLAKKFVRIPRIGISIYDIQQCQ